jgi:hypothetical protein
MKEQIYLREPEVYLFLIFTSLGGMRGRKIVSRGSQ